MSTETRHLTDAQRDAARNGYDPDHTLEAQAHCVELAASLPCPVEAPVEGFAIREMGEAGADVLILARTDA